MNHTPEPWVYSPERDTHDYVIHKENPRIEFDQVVAEDGIFGSSEWTHIKPEDARRAVACVNALAGLNPDAVAGVVNALEAAFPMLVLAANTAAKLGDKEAMYRYNETRETARIALAALKATP